MLIIGKKKYITPFAKVHKLKIVTPLLGDSGTKASGPDAEGDDISNNAKSSVLDWDVNDFDDE